MLQKIITIFLSPLTFALGFLSPLIAEVLTLLEFSSSLPNIAIGLGIGCSLGLMAQIRGSWLWVKP